MQFFRQLKNVFKRALAARGYEIYRRPYLPKGADVFESLRAHWPHWQPRVVFDVGANVGQTVARLRPLFPVAEIHAFEPVPTAFATLETNVRHDARVHCHALALADRVGETWMRLHSSSEHNSLNPALRNAAGTGGPEVRIELDTAANFCVSRGIQQIDLLKIDVEGFELAVLQGAVPLFAVGAVDFIVTEAGLMPGNARFTPLHAIIDRLRPHGFWLVGIYEQFGHRYHQGADFCNVLFSLEKHLTPRAHNPE